MSNPDYIAEKGSSRQRSRFVYLLHFVIMISPQKNAKCSWRCSPPLVPSARRSTWTCWWVAERLMNWSCQSCELIFGHPGKYITSKERCSWYWSCWFAGGARGRICHRICERTNSFSRYQFCAEEEGFGSFYDNLLSNSRRYVSLFAEAADELMPRRASDLMDEDDTFDILLQQVKTLGSLSSRHISKHLLHREKMLRQILMMRMVLIKDCPTYCGAVSEFIWSPA